MAISSKFSSANRLTKGYIIAFIGTIIWSSTAIIIRFLTETFHMPPVLLAFWRDLIVFFTLLILLAIIKPTALKINRSGLLLLAIYGFVLSLFNTSWTISVAYNGAAVSTVMAYSSAAFTAIFGWKLFHERLDPPKFLAVLMSLIGCAFVSGAYAPAVWQLNPIGVITGICSGLAFAAYSLMGRYASQRQINPLTTLVYSFGFAAFFLLIYNQFPIAGTPARPDFLWLGSSWVGWGALILLAVVPTIGGYGLYNVSLTYLPASLANLIATLEPAFTAVQAYLFLGETMSLPQIIGSVVILVSVLFIRWYEGHLLAMEQAPEPA
jgi:drug/metabolite transporter (DMT)-like permease